MAKRTQFLLLILLWLTRPGWAQQYVFGHLSVENGLSNSSVTSICQDSRGFMWFGTFHGLNKYDGYTIKPYLADPGNPRALGDNTITCLYEDSRHTLWVGTRMGGLHRYDRAQDAFIRYTQEAGPAHRISANGVECIFEDSRGRLWVGTNYGLNLLDRGTNAFRSFYFNPRDSTSLNSNQVYSVIENHRRQVLILTNAGALNQYDAPTRSFRRVPVGAAATLKTARLLCQDRQGAYWVGTLDFGLFRCRGSQVRQYQHRANQPRSLSHSQVRAVLQTRRGQLLVGTDGGGISVYQPGSDDFTAVRASEENPGSLSSNAVYCLYEDRAGTLWVGTFGGGVNFYSPFKVRFAHYAPVPGADSSLSSRSVLAVYQDTTGGIWLGTDGGGLDLFDPRRGTFRHFRHHPADPYSLSADVVKTIYEDRAGTLWVGTYLGGLNRYDRARNRFERYVNVPGQANSLTNNIVWALYEDRRRQFWVSTLGGGLCLMNRAQGTFTRFPPFAGPGAVGDYNVVTMQEDAGGTLWLGTENNGLNRYHPRTRTFSYLRHDPRDPASLSSNRVQVLFSDSRGRFWVGTADGGLNLMNADQRTFQHFTTRSGLPSNVINSIVEDQTGNLWISTSHGLSRFDVNHHTFRNFDREDGLQSNEFNVNSALRTRAGKLYFGGINGFNVFTPRALTRNPTVPPVVLTDVRVFTRSVSPGRPAGLLRQHVTEADTLRLSYKESVVTFQFAALNFLDPQKNRYAYRLEGFDEEWRYAGTRREATYTNLDPGRYIFRVRAANNDGVWNLRGATLTVIITPPWWKTLWFRSVAGLLALGSVAGLYQLRANRLRKKLRLEKLQALRLKEAELREARLQHEKTLMELNKARLEREILHKNSELATSVMSAVQQNETLLTIKDKIKEAIEVEDAQQQRQQMQRITRLIEREVKPDQQWEHFEELFNQLHENFMQRLKETYPQLTGRDIKLCAYLRMNLDSKEVASLMGISMRGIEDLRYRVRKKMGLDTTVNLAEFILLM